MPYKSTEKRTEAVRRHRDYKKGLQKEGLPGGITIDKDKAIKLLKICNSLDRTIQGLGKRENMLGMVRYGGINMEDIKIQLGG